jgi:microcystin-dependent protein
MDMEIITKDTNTFDNLLNRPTRPTDEDISNAMTPLPPLVRNGFFVGQVITMSGNQAPQGTLVCDGTVYNIEDYPDLANYYEASQGSKNFYGGDGTTTFAVPDYRGEFLRGSGTNSHSGQGNGANVGVHQDGTTHPLTFSWEGSIYSTNTENGEAYSNYDVSKKTGKRVSVSGTSTSDANVGDYYTTRPTNTSVLHCVVY